MSGWFTSFLNCRLCVDGQLVEDQLVVSDDSGLILPRTGYIGGDAVDLEEGIIAPGLLELHTNGLLGFHFTHFTNEQEYAAQIDKAAKFLVTQGVTGFWATVPTVSSDEYKKVVKRSSFNQINNSLVSQPFANTFLGPVSRRSVFERIIQGRQQSLKECVENDQNTIQRRSLDARC